MKQTWKLDRCIAAILASGAMLSAANAQDSGILEEIVVTAQKREQSLQEVPISVATLSGENLEALFSGGEDILALSSRVPGLYAESSNGRVAPRFYLRGLGNIDFDLGASQPVSVVMDEVVMENVVLKSFPLFDLGNVEVIRGPQGTLFGRNTTAGIVKFNTRRPTSEPEGYAQISAGTYNSLNFEGAISGSLSDTVTGRLSVLSQSRDDWIDNGFTGERDAMGAYDELALRAQLMWEPSDDFSALLSLQGRDLDGTASIFRANVFTTGSNDLNRNYDRDTVYYDGGDNNPQEYDGFGATLTLDWDRGDYSISSITSMQEADGFSRGDIDGGVVDFSGMAVPPPGIDAVVDDGFVSFPGFIPFPSVTQDGADTDQFTQEFRIASNSTGPLSWQTGFFYFDSELTVTTESFASFGFVSRQDTQVEYTNETWAIFGQLEYDVSDQLTLTGGLRYTDDEKSYEVKQFGQLYLDLGIPPAAPINVEDDDVSWDLAANYILTDQSSLYSRLSSGFRAQTIQGRDVAFLEFPTAAESENILSFEVGYKADMMDDRLRINMAGFWYEVDDMQLSIIGGASNSNQVINADNGEALGFEIDFQYLASENLAIGGGFAWNDTEIDDPNLFAAACGSGQCTVLDPLNELGQASLDGNPFPRAPETTFNFWVSYTHPLDNGNELFFHTDWAWQGDLNMPLYEAVEFMTDSQYEGGMRFGYRDNPGNWELALYGRNITDEDNVKGFIDFNNNTGFVNEPQIWGVEFLWSFGDR